LNEQRITSNHPDETREIARDLALRLSGGAIVALYGELGSGKTCFVQGIARALDVGQPVTSPTFTMVNEYAGSRPLYHVDLYRLNDPDEMFALGFEEYLDSDGITAVEWAERAGDLIPADALHVHMSLGSAPDERLIRIVSP